MKKLLVVTGGGDCPGLNAVIRAITKAAHREGDWEVWGGVEAFVGVMKDPPELIRLTLDNTAGIHIKGGTILRTTNAMDPLAFPVQLEDGSWTYVNRCPDLAERIKALGFDALINIGGDGSQRISRALQEAGLPVVGVPKTIDNDIAATDLSFGFLTAVQTATDSFDKLVSTAESHHRVMIMEVMGRHAGWIALHTALAGGAEVCLLPEIPYNVDRIVERINKRFENGKAFANIVVAEGARPLGGEVVGKLSEDIGDLHIKLGGIGNVLRHQLEENGCRLQVRTTILGHVQRGGSPIAFDRVLSAAMGIKAFELVRERQFGKMVAWKQNEMEAVPLEIAAQGSKSVPSDHFLVYTARSMGISFGD